MTRKEPPFFFRLVVILKKLKDIKGVIFLTRFSINFNTYKDRYKKGILELSIDKTSL